MRLDWVEKSLGDVLTLQRGHDLPSQSRCTGSVPVMGSAGVTGYHHVIKANGPGVIVGRSGNSMGEVHFISEDYWPLNTSLYVTDFKGNDERFIYFLLKTINFDQFNSGSAQKSLNRNAVYPFKVRVPEDIKYQGWIAAVLSDFEEKIVLNIQIKQSLEKMAQAIFKSWFVDFDPVRAKMAGRQPEGMNAVTAALFPSELVDSELGLIPKGWSVAALKHLTSKIGSGATPKGGREVYLDEGVALIRSQNVYDSEFVWDGLARISDDAATQLKGVEIFPEDVLLNITGASILRTCVVPQEVLPARVNQHVAIIRAKVEVSPRYLHLHLLQRQVKDYLLGLNTGGSREAVTKTHIESVPILNPGRDVLLTFQQTVEPLFSEIGNLASQMRVLSDIRDTLLPKLLSGEISPLAAEKLAEQAVV